MIGLLLLLLAAWGGSQSALASGTEPFPPVLTIADGDEQRQLALTGNDRRVVLIFRVYDIAHYAESSDLAPMSVANVIDDGPAKAISIRFLRKLRVNQIRQEFDASLRLNGQPEWLEAAQPTIDAFLAAIDRDASKGDRFSIVWLDGGRLFAEFNGERAFEASDTAFAKLIWSIWFGEEPVCDRDKLLAELTAEDDA
ncbi:MAG: chalcone isomerase family protein [Pseudomonadota bacterium]